MIKPVFGVLAFTMGIGLAGMGCDGGLQRDMVVVSPEEEVATPFRLGKAAVDAAAQQAVVHATVSNGGAPLGNVRVAFSRSISGRAPDYRWSGTTDDMGKVEIAISPAQGARVSGMYMARATNPGTGEVIGVWHSISVNGDRHFDMDMPVGARASVRSQAFVALVQHFADYKNWQAVDYTIGLTNPATGQAHQARAEAYSRRTFRSPGASLAGNQYGMGSIYVKEVFTWENGQKKIAEEAGILAMAKRGGGFNPEGDGWEWFLLSNGGEILHRGGKELMDGGCNACHTGANSQAGGADMVFPHPVEYVATQAVFEGYRDWTRIDERSGPSPLLGPAHNPDAVRRIYKKQPLANPDTREQGYPIGTVFLKEVQAEGQVVEITAMVKRGGAFNQANNGWEWFMLEPTGAIDGRGANLLDNGCNSCHTAALNPENGKDYVFKHPGDPFNN